MSAKNTTPTKAPSKYRLSEDHGWPYPLEIADVKPVSYDWGEVAGYSLALDLFQWREAFYLAYEHNPQVKEQEAAAYVRGMMENAVETMSKKGDNSAVAVALIEALALLVVKALEHKPNAEIIERIRAESVQYYEDANKDAKQCSLDLRRESEDF